MKKIMSLIIAMTLVSSSTFASTQYTASQANHLQMIGKTFDHFRYKITVEGDASNIDFQKKAANDFCDDLANLEKQGVSTSEIVNYLRNSILNASTLQDFDLMMSKITKESSPEDTSNMIMQYMSAKYKNGASYAGGAAAAVAISLIIAGVIVTIFVIDANQRNNDNNNCHFDGNGIFVCP